MRIIIASIWSMLVFYSLLIFCWTLCWEYLDFFPLTVDVNIFTRSCFASWKEEECEDYITGPGNVSAAANPVTADFLLTLPLGLYYYLIAYEVPPISWKWLLLNNSSRSMQKADRGIEIHDNYHLTEILENGGNSNWPISRRVKYNCTHIEVLFDYHFEFNLIY